MVIIEVVNLCAGIYSCLLDISGFVLQDLSYILIQVIIAGNGNQILEAMKPAEDLREQLMDVATYIIQAPIFGKFQMCFQSRRFQLLQEILWAAL